MWDRIRRELDSRYDVLAPDLPGHGSRRRGRYSLNSAVQCVVETAQSVAPASVVVGGDSLGGNTALAAAAALPGRQFKGLILCGSSSNLKGSALLPYRLESAFLLAATALFGEERVVRSQVPKQLASMQVEHPLVIVNGDRDQGQLRQEASFVAAARQPMTHRIANCEHGVALRRPAEVAAIINNFAAKAFALEGHPAYRSFA